MSAYLYSLAPGGRWSRILAECRHQARTQAQLLNALHDGRYSRNREAKKIRAACMDLQDRGLLARTDRHSVLTTPAGAQALDALQRSTDQ